MVQFVNIEMSVCVRSIKLTPLTAHIVHPGNIGGNYIWLVAQSILKIKIGGY